MAVPRSVVVSVFVSQIDAPNIIRVIVERDKREVRATSNTLKPTIQRTALGAIVQLHEGQALYPCSAFLPGSTVTVTAIPNVGTNLARTLSQPELTQITGVRHTTAMAAVSGDLVGFTGSQVRAVLREPQQLDGSRCRTRSTVSARSICMKPTARSRVRVQRILFSAP